MEGYILIMLGSIVGSDFYFGGPYILIVNRTEYC